MANYCDSCKKTYTANEKFCKECGSKLKLAESEKKPLTKKKLKYCENCGNELSDGNKFCKECGSKIEKSEVTKEPLTIDQKALDTAEKNIKIAATMGFISAGITAVVAITAELGVDLLQEMGFSLWSLLDAILVAGLAIGTYKKNRACATILFVYYLICQIIFLGAGNGNIIGLFIWGSAYFLGAKGTIDYHKITGKKV